MLVVDEVTAGGHRRDAQLNTQHSVVDALHGQRETAQNISDMGGYYLQFIKANQSDLMEYVALLTAGIDDEFVDGASWAEEERGHGRRERRSIRTGPWTSKEIALGIPNLPADVAGPRHIAAHARRHRAVENSEHYVRGVTFREDAQKTRTGSQPNALPGIRNLVTGTFRRKGRANIAAACRHYSRGEHTRQVTSSRRSRTGCSHVHRKGT